MVGALKFLRNTEFVVFLDGTKNLKGFLVTLYTAVAIPICVRH